MGTDSSVCDQHNKRVSTLDKYLKSIPKRECKIDFSKFDGRPMTQNDLCGIQKIKNVLKRAEDEMNKIALASAKPTQQPKTVYMDEPSYFDDNFDEKAHIQKLVNATIEGMKVVYKEPSSKTKKKILSNQKMETSKSSEKLRPAVVKNNYESNRKIINIDRDAVLVSKSNIKLGQKNLKRSGTDCINIPGNVTQDSNSVKHVKSFPCAGINSKYFEVKSVDRDDTVEEPIQMHFSKKLSVQVIPGINIRTQLTEQKIPALEISPGDESKMVVERSKNVSYVQAVHGENKGVKKKHVKIQSPKDALVHDKNKIKQKIASQNESLVNKLCNPQLGIYPEDEILKNTESRQLSNNFIFLNSNNNSEESRKFKCDHSQISTNKRNVSKLKKFGYPEIQKIYNPKGVNPIKRLSSYGHGLSSNINKSNPIHTASTSYSQYVPHSSSSTRHYSNNDNSFAFTFIDKPTHTEYIPYSQLTLGGRGDLDINLSSRRNIKTRSHSSIGEKLFKTTQSDQNQGHFLSESSEDDKIHSSVRSFDVEIKNTSADDKSDTSNEILNYQDQDNEVENEQSAKSDEEKSASEYDDDFDVDNSESHNSSAGSKVVASGSSTERKNNNTKLNENIESSRRSLSSLNMKNKIDVFDFIHHRETKDYASQINNDNQSVSTFKETQTSPVLKDEVDNTPLITNERSPQKILQKVDIECLTLEDMLKIQKGLLFLDNYVMNSDKTKNNSENRSTSKNVTFDVDIDSVSEKTTPKDTQTSPMKTVNVMTSPAKVMHRNLSPMFQDMKIDAQTSPDEFTLLTSKIDSPCIEINSPTSTKNIPTKPTTSQQKESNVRKISPRIENESNSNDVLKRDYLEHNVSSENPLSESSDTQSLGEIKLSFSRKRSFIIKSKSNCNSLSSTSFMTSSSSDLHFDSTNYTKKSDGEVSVGQVLDKI